MNSLHQPRALGREVVNMEEPKTLRFSDVLAALKRRILLVLAVAGTITILTIYYLYSLTPIYSAQGLIALGEQGLASQRRFDFEETQALNSSVIEGELAILRSNEVLARVARRLDLNALPEFNPSLREDTGDVDVIKSTVDFLKHLLLPIPETPETEVDPNAEPSAIQLSASANAVSLGEVGDAVGILRSKIYVRQQGSSFVVAVTAGAESAEASAAIVNAMMEEYILFLTDKRFKAAQRFTSWLEERVADLAGRLEDSEKEVLAFRLIMESDMNSTERLEQQMREMTTKLVNARANYVEVASQSRRFTEISEEDGLLAASAVLSSPTTSSYREDLSNLRRQEAAAIISFGPTSSQVKSIGRAMSILEEAIEAEVMRELETMENQTKMLSNSVSALESGLRELENLGRSRSSEQIRLDQLNRIARANRRVYEEFLARLNESSEIQNLRSTDAEVVSYASPPSAPTFPNKKVSAALSLVGGLLIGSALALLLELRNLPLRNARAISRQTGLSVYGHIPEIKPGRFVPLVNDRVQKGFTRPVAESLAMLSQTIMMALDNSGKTVLITSNADRNVKSRTAFELAIAISNSGKTCLLMDCDTRTSYLTKQLSSAYGGSKPFEKTLTDCLINNLTPKDAIYELQTGKLYFLPTTSTDGDPATIFRGERPQAIFEWLKEHFDCVIIDGPKLNDTFDVISLNKPFDSTFLVMPTNTTFVEKLNSGAHLMASHNVDEMGIILTGPKYANKVRNLRSTFALSGRSAT